MFRRVFWFGLGTGLGFGSSMWLTRWVKGTAARYAPASVTAQVGTAVKGVGDDLKAALADGRSAMRQREQELRSQLDRSRYN